MEKRPEHRKSPSCRGGLAALGVDEFCGYCYANVRGRSAFKGHRGYRPRPKLFVSWEGYVVKRPDVNVAGGKVSGSSCPDEQFLKSHPTLTLYMTDATWDDGSSREVSVLSVSFRDGFTCLALNDKDLKQSLYTQAETLREALKLMEGALRDGTGVWRSWKAGKKK